MSDIIHAHALGILLDKPIPEPKPSRTKQRAAHTAALQAAHTGELPHYVHEFARGVIQRLNGQEMALAVARDERDKAALRAEDMRKAAETWCTRTAEQHKRANFWRLVALAATLAALGWIAGSVAR